MILADGVDRHSDHFAGDVALSAPELDRATALLLADAEYKARRKRCEFISPDLLGEPAWDILLDLFIQDGRGKEISVSSACKGSGSPDSTGLRWMIALEAHNLIERRPSTDDKRVQLVRLTEMGTIALLEWLRYRGSLTV